LRDLADFYRAKDSVKRKTVPGTSKVAAREKLAAGSRIAYPSLTNKNADHVAQKRVTVRQHSRRAPRSPPFPRVLAYGGNDMALRASNMRRLLLAAAVICSLLPLAGKAEMYRCGNEYQDHPCEGSQTGKPVKGVGKTRNSPTSEGVPAASDPVCSQRAADAQTIVWAREAGVTEEQAMAKETDKARKQLVASVYRVRGSAPQVRARIEAECKTEMEEHAKALALHAAMVNAGVTPPGGTPQVNVSAAPSPQPSAAIEQPIGNINARATSEARAKKERCDRLAADMESTRAMQRQGGTSTVMDSHNLRLRNTQREYRRLEC
jgi:hypothetical protein